MKVKPSPKETKEGLRQLTSVHIYKSLIYIQSTSLTNNQYLALLYIYYNSGCRYNDIRKLYGWDTSYNYRIIQGLSNSGYVDIKYLGTKTSYTTLTELGFKVCKSLLSIK